MEKIDIIDYEDIRAAVTTKDLLKPLADAFVAFSRGRTQSPPVVDLQFPEVRGETHIRSASSTDLPYACTKIVSCFYTNPARGLPTRDGLMVLLSTETGAPVAVLLDRGYLTDIRTAAAGAVAADVLSRPDSKVAGLVGAGTQAFHQLASLLLVRQMEKVLIWEPLDRSGGPSQRVAAFARRVEEELGIVAKRVNDVGEVFGEADVVVTATPSREPLVTAELLRPGQHITAMGSDVEGKQELEVQALLDADVLVTDGLEQSLRIGELQHLKKLIGVDATAEHARELGRVIAGDVPGRRSPEEITIADLTGLAIQDVVAAELAYRRCRQG